MDLGAVKLIISHVRLFNISFQTIINHSFWVFYIYLLEKTHCSLYNINRNIHGCLEMPDVFLMLNPGINRNIFLMLNPDINQNIFLMLNPDINRNKSGICAATYITWVSCANGE